MSKDLKKCFDECGMEKGMIQSHIMFKGFQAVVRNQHYFIVSETQQLLNTANLSFAPTRHLRLMSELTNKTTTY